MSGPNADAINAMSAAVEHPVFFAFLDIVGDPIRVTTAPYSMMFSLGMTGDADLDGYTYSAIDHELVSVSDVRHKEGGAETVTIMLSGVRGIDTTLLDQISDKSNWQGRAVRLWRCQFSENYQQTGNIWPFHTGYMTVPKIIGDRTSQTIVLDTESYLSFLTAASNRSYLDQTDYDSGDLSAQASIACANGTSAAGSMGTATGASEVSRNIYSGSGLRLF